MKCSKCGKPFQDGSNVCPWCGTRVRNPVRKHTGINMISRWSLIIFASFVCLFTAFLPLLSVYSKPLGAYVGWDLRGLYSQVKKLDTVLENETVQSVTDGGIFEEIVESISGVDTSEVYEDVCTLRIILIVLIILILTALAANLICALVCFTRKDILKTFFVTIACLSNISTVAFVLFICCFLIKKLDPAGDFLSNLETLIGYSSAETVNLGQLRPGSACAVFVIMTAISVCTIVKIRLGKNKNTNRVYV